MGNLEEFKSFVKENPGLIKYVKSNEMTWQKFYELYDLYGKDESAWEPFLNKEEVTKTAETVASTATLGEFFNWFKNINLDKLQDGVNSLQRVVGVLGDLSPKNESAKEEYKPRPLYKNFDD